MLDNERLIEKMLLEQKLSLVTSAKLYKSSPVGTYEFPVVRFRKRPLKGEDVAVTQFPSDSTLASSWNTELVEKVFSYAGEEARTHDVYSGYISSNDPNAQGVSSSHYLLSQYYAARDRGAADKQPTAHRVAMASFGEEMLRKNLTDTLLSEGAPDVLIAECVEDAQLYLKNHEFGGLVYGIASSPEEAARYFFVGCSFVYLKEDFFEELCSFFDTRTKNYRVAYGEYKENRLPLKELDRRARILDVFDEGIIDIACDRMINFLKKRKKAEVVAPEKPSAAEIKSAKLEEEEHIRLAKKAAIESAVLLKNANRFLPLKRGTKVALVGEYFENADFQLENFPCNPTRKKLPIDVAKDYAEHLAVTGYAAGYRKGEGIDEELLSNAAKISSASDCTVVFLSAEPNQDDLPENQKMLIKTLLGWKKKVVAVISADRCVNTSFASGCQSILFMGRGGQEEAAAAFDIITGEGSPSGKLAMPVNGAGGYPFGYGLTYTMFEYRDLKIDENGVSVLVENKGDYDASAIVQMYLKKEGSMYADKTLKGFCKAFVKKGDLVRVNIPFTENTFRYYDGEKKKYRAQGGVYHLYISESATADKLAGTVKIASNDGYTFMNTLSETATDGQKIAFSESGEAKERKGMSFGMKFFLLFSLLIYFNIVAALLLFAEFVPIVRTDVFYGITGALSLLIDGGIIAGIATISIKRKARFIPVTDTLSDMVDKVDEFVEIAKETYPDPVKERAKAKKKKEEEEEGEKQEVKEGDKVQSDAKSDEKKKETKEEKKEGTSEEKKEESKPSLDDAPSDYPQTDSFEKMCASFRQYLMGCGINIGAGSARRVLAAIAASRLVLITSKNTDLLPEFLEALNRYFGGIGVTFADDEWNTLEDLLWREANGRSQSSAYANSAIAASRKHNKNVVALIGNVNSKNFPDWFSEMVDFAASPSEEHVIVLNADTKFAIRQNFCSLLFAQENGFETEIPRFVLNASMQIDISIRREESNDTGEKTQEAVSYPNFCALVREAREKYYLSEKNWVRIDSLFEFVGENERFPFGNKNTLMAEKFTSVLLACGAEEGEALTSLLRFKIIPLIKTSSLYEQEDGIIRISEFLQKNFPDDDLSKVQKLLSERPKKSEERADNTFYTPNSRRKRNLDQESFTEEERADRPFEAVEQERATPSSEQEKGEESSDSVAQEPAFEAERYENTAPAYENDSTNSAPVYGEPVYGFDQGGDADETVVYGNKYEGRDGAENYGNDQNGYNQNSYDQNSYDQSYGDYGKDSSSDRNDFNNGGGERG